MFTHKPAKKIQSFSCSKCVVEWMRIVQERLLLLFYGKGWGVDSEAPRHNAKPSKNEPKNFAKTSWYKFDLQLSEMSWENGGQCAGCDHHQTLNTPSVWFMVITAEPKLFRQQSLEMHLHFCSLLSLMHMWINAVFILKFHHLSGDINPGQTSSISYLVKVESPSKAERLPVP